MFRLDVHEDAHEPADRTVKVDSVGEAVLKAAKIAENELAEEATRLQVGSAGDDEAFEMYPDPGHGTVVVTEV